MKTIAFFTTTTMFACTSAFTTTTTRLAFNHVTKRSYSRSSVSMMAGNPKGKLLLLLLIIENGGDDGVDTRRRCQCDSADCAITVVFTHARTGRPAA